MNIKTTYDPKPIHPRGWDWIAVDTDNDMDGKLHGSGATEADAIADLMEQIEIMEENN